MKPTRDDFMGTMNQLEKLCHKLAIVKGKCPLSFPSRERLYCKAINCFSEDYKCCKYQGDTVEMDISIREGRLYGFWECEKNV